jgi:hypothetical protein
MPPKRVQKPVDQPADTNPTKKLKTNDSFSVASSTTSSDDRQVCWYDGNCKQKNPVHWQTYKYVVNVLIKKRDISYISGMKNKLLQL